MKEECGVLLDACSQLSEELSSDILAVPRDSEIWRFSRTWLRRLRTTSEQNYVERFIYLWVTFNAWAAQVVPAESQNHLDRYLIRCVAGSERFRRRFDSLMETNRQFRCSVESLCRIGPVIKVLWLRNRGIAQWDIERESRHDYLRGISDRLETAGRPLPFSPDCALHHLRAGEGIPADWPHVLWMIYQVRCNLFHGGKDYDSARDRVFIELAQSILWEIWHPEIPSELGRTRFLARDQRPASLMPWERALVISGFVFEPLACGFDMSQESPYNLAYLRDLLSDIGLEEDLVGGVFTPRNPTVGVKEWIRALEARHEGAEAGPVGFFSLDLRLMDAYMAGVIRWLNFIGIRTLVSCDGHGVAVPWISTMSQEDAHSLSRCLETLSAGQWRYDPATRRLINVLVRGRRNYDRAWLFDLAEALYRSRVQLREMVAALRHEKC
jgi:hypothetical protein